MLIPDPLSPEEHLTLGLAYERSGELDLALREYEAARGLPLADLGRANVLFQLGRYRRAEAAYRRLLKGELGPEAANNLAFMLVLEGRSPEKAYRLASQAVDEGIRRNLDDEQIRNFKNTRNQAEMALMNRDAAKGRLTREAPDPAWHPFWTVEDVQEAQEAEAARVSDAVDPESGPAGRDAGGGR
jgi:tetratricopeptide (TPR) repeat protein